MAFSGFISSRLFASTLHPAGIYTCSALSAVPPSRWPCNWDATHDSAALRVSRTAVYLPRRVVTMCPNGTLLRACLRLRGLMYFPFDSPARSPAFDSSRSLYSPCDGFVISARARNGNGMGRTWCSNWTIGAYRDLTFFLSFGIARYRLYVVRDQLGRSSFLSGLIVGGQDDWLMIFARLFQIRG